MGTAHRNCRKHMQIAWKVPQMNDGWNKTGCNLKSRQSPFYYHYCTNIVFPRVSIVSIGYFLHSTDRSDLSVQWKAELMSQGINAECDTPAWTCQVCISNNTLRTRPRCQISALERDMDCPPSFIIDASEADACKGQRPLSHFVKTPSEWMRTLLRPNL